MKTVLSRPWVWFLPQFALLLALFLFLDHFKVAKSGDSELFLELSHLSLREYLTYWQYQLVPYGYPLFVQWVREFAWLVGKFPSELAILPLCHLLVHCGAVLLFWVGLRGVLASAWLALLAASCLLYSNLILLHGQFIMSDALGSSLAIATLGLFLLLARNPANLLAWFGFTVCLTGTYHVRAAYLFLLPLLPLLGPVVAGLVLPRERWRRLWLRLFTGLAVVGFVPFLSYCTLRWTLHDDASFLAMGDNSLFGITGPLLTPDLLPQLPPEAQPLARAIVDYRRREILKHLGYLPPDAPAPDEGMVADAGPEPTPNEVADAVQEEAVKQLAASIAYLEPGALTDLYQRTGELKDDSGVFNWTMLLLVSSGVPPDTPRAQLKALNTAILRLRPGAYRNHVLKTLRMGVTGVLLNGYALHLLVSLLAGLVFAWHVLFLFRRLWRGAGLTDRPAPPADADQIFAFHLLVLLGGSFALANVLQLSLVTLATLRYADAASVFLPSALVPVVFMLWGKIRGTDTSAVSP